MANRPEDSCEAFASVGDLDPNVLHRFVIGSDQRPRGMEVAQVQAELGDPLATLVFGRGRFPESTVDLLDAIDKADGEETLGPTTQQSFWLGEGSQIPWSDDTKELKRGLRFIVTRGNGNDGPDVLISAFDPNEGFVEAMSWDAKSGGFNFYRTGAREAPWIFAGNSLDAVRDPPQRKTQGKGPFESHTGGNFLMKEFRFPWNHWHSKAAKAEILPAAFAPIDRRPEHPLFENKAGADVCEIQVAKRAIERWTRTRCDRIIGDGIPIEDPARLLEHVLTTPTVNLVSSKAKTADAPSTETIDLPETFFIDSESLAGVVGLDKPRLLRVPSAIYLETLRKFAVTLRGNGGFERPGDTHFAFLVPEKAIEDVTVLREAVSRGLITKRLAACLAMVDFPNPIFSARREALLAHTPASASVAAGRSTFSEEMGEAIKAAADGAGADSPEAEFAVLWDTEDGFVAHCNRLLGAYFEAVSAKLATQEGFDGIYRLAESRRGKVREMPIFENRLLLPESKVTPGPRQMQVDGTVVWGTG